MSTGRLGAGDTAIQPTILDAKGDLIVATAADTPARLAVGSANQVLTVDSSTATGLKWATPSAGDAGPSFGAYIAVEHSGISANTWTKITFNAEDWDTASNFSTSTYRFTPTTAGYYQINLQIMANGNSTQCAIYKNGSIESESTIVPVNTDCMTAKIFYMNGSSDYLEGYGKTAGNTVYGSKAITYFSGALVRTA
jgi:hypothetical protein